MNTTKVYPATGDVQEILALVTSTFLQVEAVPFPSAEGPRELATAEVWSGCVTLSGAFDGAVILTCTRVFARKVAETIFELPEVTLPDDAARDAWAELTNMVGGNVKSLFSAVRGSVCRLSLPVVASGEITIPNAVLLQELWCACGPDSVRVSVYEAAGDSSAMAC